MRTLIIGALLCALCGCGSGDGAALVAQSSAAEVAGNSSLAESVWGGGDATLTILPDGARFDALCQRGTIAEVVRVDRDGAFDVAGTLRRAGGARLDPEESARSVRFIGRVSGDTMTLRIEDAERHEVLHTTLKKGVHGDARPCA